MDGLKVATTRPAYTPGPWEVYREEDVPEAGEEWRMGIRSLAPDEAYLNLVEGAYFVINGEPSRRFENQANARLIAAAPELYEALTEIADHVASISRMADKDYGDVKLYGADLNALHARVRDARTALAKADGR